MNHITKYFSVFPLGLLLVSLISCASTAPEKSGGQFDGNILVGRVSDQSASISIMVFSDSEVYVEYGNLSEQYTQNTEKHLIKANDLYVFEVTGLDANQEYFYRVRYRGDSSQNFTASSEYSFDTQKSPDSTFSFAVQADPHLGARTRFEKWCGDRCLREAADDKVYAKTAANMLSYDPDFLIDLGDTFMTAQNFGNGLFAVQNREGGAPITESEVVDDVLYLRQLFTQVGSSIPVILVQGNHEAEDGGRLNGTPDNIAVWAVNARKKYFPSPTDNGFYSGSTTEYDFIGRQDGYFAWRWGNALFVGLDPYWAPNEGSDAWARSLGREQYDWLKQTLENSDATFKFVFLHHLIGGSDNPYGRSRGGALYSDYFEWGGRTPYDYEKWDPASYSAIDSSSTNADGGTPPVRRVDTSTESFDFAQYRPGWEAPIQQLLIDNNVQIVFHGHDHLYAKEVHPSGIIYQEVPQPARAGHEFTQQQLMQSAGWKGYDTERGVIIENAGYLNVTVAPDHVTVDYVKNIEDCDSDPCGEVAESYTVYAGE